MRNIETGIAAHSDGSFSLRMQGDDVTLNTLTHGYSHKPGNHSIATFQGVTLDDMLELAGSILASVTQQRKEMKNDSSGR